MTLAVFDLNDSAIGHGNNAESWQYSPGFALLADGRIITGEEARNKAWLNPQQSFQQYWHQLNLSPLAVHNNSARHHADLAYAQLQQLYRDSGEPQQVILAVPGSFNREQLGLLLGLVKPLPFSAIGLVDSAVAAVSTQPPSGSALHLDIQQHQSLITRLDNHGELHSTGLEAVSNLGMKQLLDHWAHYVADQFIRQYRYDPLHTASGEQQLYDQLPQWLATAREEPQIAVSLDTPKGDFHLNLMRDDLLACAQPRLKQLRQAVEAQRLNGESLYLSHRAAHILGLPQQLGDHRVLPASAVLQGCLNNRSQICTDSDSLGFVSALTLEASTTADAPPAAVSAVSPSHLLVGHRALPLGRQLGLRNTAAGIEACDSDQAEVVLDNRGSQLQIQTVSGVSLSAPDSLQAGAVIEWQQQRLQLIVVAEG
ncbi:hypothetical protein KFE80_06900 [bacterium SCSIO 12696]|nr:hypothetical protein KFE80_06900 [bacterium SCSIO 12696]